MLCSCSIRIRYHTEKKSSKKKKNNCGALKTEIRGGRIHFSFPVIKKRANCILDEHNIASLPQLLHRPKSRPRPASWQLGGTFTYITLHIPASTSTRPTERVRDRW